MNTDWRGIFVIVVTPFDDNGELDEKGLRRVIRFCVDAGAQGLVGPANASEFAFLSDDERRRWIEIVATEVAGQIPFVAATTSGHTRLAVELSRFAEKTGADGIMAMPPHIIHPEAEGCFEYFETLSKTVNVPICVQNYIGPVGTPMSPELLARMCTDLPNVQYVKEETVPEPRRLGRVAQLAGSACRGVFGGQAGIYMLDEFRRGSVGNMPACQAADVHAEIWKLLEAGDQNRARTLFNRLLPLMNYERLYGVAVYKEVLYRRGVISHRFSRHPSGSLEAEDRAELNAIMADVEPLFTA